MPNEYISLAERLKQVQQGRKRKFSQMMKPVLNRIEQMSQLKEKEEGEEQQLSAINKIYGGDVERYGLDLDEYKREEFGTPANYEQYVRAKIKESKPEYTSKLKEAKKIGQIKRDFVDAYGEEALKEIDINDLSTYADWDREIEQYGDRLEQKRTETENRRKITNQIIANVGMEKAGKLNLQGRTLPEMKVLLAQTKYQKGQGEGEGKTESEIGLTKAQNQNLSLLTKRYGVRPYEGEENKLFTLKYLEALDDISAHPDNLDEVDDETKILIRELTGREKGALKADEAIKAIKNEMYNRGYIEGPQLNVTPGSEEAKKIFNMSREEAIGTSFGKKKTKEKKPEDPLGIL